MALSNHDPSACSLIMSSSWCLDNVGSNHAVAKVGRKMIYSYDDVMAYFEAFGFWLPFCSEVEKKGTKCLIPTSRLEMLMQLRTSWTHINGGMDHLPVIMIFNFITANMGLPSFVNGMERCRHFGHVCTCKFACQNMYMRDFEMVPVLNFITKK